LTSSALAVNFLTMKSLIFFAILSTLSAHAGSKSYPLAPDPKLTPGSLCTSPDRYRYPEQIPYCERNLNSFAKEHIFITYRKELGFGLSGDRANFKVDHFIPLCAGGSNNDDNLWPQHISISKVTDPLESMGCEKLGKARLTQKELIDLIVKAKLNLKEAPKVLRYLRSLN
jgi:hypothetical protein